MFLIEKNVFIQSYITRNTLLYVIKIFRFFFLIEINLQKIIEANRRINVNLREPEIIYL